MEHKCKSSKDIEQGLNLIKILGILKNGLKSGINTTWLLTKIIVPVYFIITILKYTKILDYIALFFAPAMKFLGLPGEAAVVLVLGNVVNLYAAIGAITSFSFTAKQITILAVMLSFSHSLFMETAVAKKTGVSVFAVLFIRFTLAIISGLVLNILI
jgi:hypothetical protein